MVFTPVAMCRVCVCVWGGGAGVVSRSKLYQVIIYYFVKWILPDCFSMEWTLWVVVALKKIHSAQKRHTVQGRGHYWNYRQLSIGINYAFSIVWIAERPNMNIKINALWYCPHQVLRQGMWINDIALIIIILHPMLLRQTKDFDGLKRFDVAPDHYCITWKE